MEQFITDKRTGLRYELVGDYYLIAGEQTNRDMGTAAFAVSEAVSQGALLQSLDKRQAEQLFCRHRPASRGNVFSAGKATCWERGCDGRTQSSTPNVVGAEDEQHPQCRYGDYFK